MSGKREIVGELSQTIEYTVEWTIKNIFSYRKLNHIKEISSPTFTLPGSLWHLSISLISETGSDIVKWIFAYLCLDELTTPKDVNCKLSVKKRNGSYKMLLQDASYLFNSEKQRKTFLYELSGSDLKVPSGDLTLACTMKLKDNLHLESFSRFNKLSENLEHLLISKRGSDATLKVQDKDFAVHRSILIARSPVLGAMFEVEKEKKNTGIVNIVDCNPETFQHFLTYIYSGKFTISSKDVFQLYRIAHKYDVEQLKSDCVAYMMHNLSVDTLLDTAIIGHTFNEIKLKNKTQAYFDKEFKKIAPTSKWKSFLEDNPPLAYELLKNMAAEIPVAETHGDIVTHKGNYLWTVFVIFLIIFCIFNAS